MAGFFSTESKFYKFMSRFTDCFVLNILWIVFSIPVVTLGISTIAAFTVALHMAEDREGSIPKEFIRAFRSNWKQGIVMSFITIICLWAVFLDFQIFSYVNNNGGNGLVFLIIGILAVYIFTFSLIYVFPLIARYENTLIASLKNSYRIGMKYFLRTVFLIIIVVIEVGLIFLNTTTLFVGALVGPAIIIFTISGMAMSIFRELEKDPKNTVRNDVEREDDE